MLSGSIPPSARRTDSARFEFFLFAACCMLLQDASLLIILMDRMAAESMMYIYMYMYMYVVNNISTILTYLEAISLTVLSDPRCAIAMV